MTRRRILIVEDKAHLKGGHFPVLFAELAGALADAGCEVTALTAQGWALQDEGSFGQLDTLTIGPAASAVRRAAGWLQRMYPRRFFVRVGFVLKDVAMVAVARAMVRRLSIDGVIVTNQLLDPFPACRGGWNERQLALLPIPPAGTIRLVK